MITVVLVEIYTNLFLKIISSYRYVSGDSSKCLKTHFVPPSKLTSSYYKDPFGMCKEHFILGNK